MAAFAVFTVRAGEVQIRPLVAADLAAAELLIENQLKRTLRTGRALYLGQPENFPAVAQAGQEAENAADDGEVLLGVVQMDSGAKIVPGVDPANPISNWNNRAQPAIPNLAGGATAATIVTKVNTMLAAMRSFGIIQP